MRRVFILSRLDSIQRDISDAESYGELIPLWSKTDSRPRMLDTTALIKDMLDRLEDKHYDPAVDLIVASGSINNLVVCIGGIVNKYGPIRVLLFSANHGGFVIRSIGAAV